MDSIKADAAGVNDPIAVGCFYSHDIAGGGDVDDNIDALYKALHRCISDPKYNRATKALLCSGFNSYLGQTGLMFWLDDDSKIEFKYFSTGKERDLQCLLLDPLGK